MTTQSTLSTRQEGEKTVLTIETNNVDFRNAELLKTEIKDLVNAGKTEIILDLSKVTFMDSAGLSVLLNGKRVTDEANGRFSICGLQGYVNNLVTLTNLNKTIPVFESDMEAIQS
ncbi:MAG: STAS domain-containing protein [Cyanobacteria bacterium HKST-UBA06]|nr:STAS domain-containing protein [Cyanobacteria bacterium HKST-UBA04]MCA9808095.1 STAS domain-containing protein [Cyanobacteria bacterium HKST-UBA06]